MLEAAASLIRKAPGPVAELCVVGDPDADNPRLQGIAEACAQHRLGQGEHVSKAVSSMLSPEQTLHQLSYRVTTARSGVRMRHSRHRAGPVSHKVRSAEHGERDEELS